MIAWLAAAHGAEIDDLALWAVPMRGRQLIRELRAAAMMTIDRRVFLGPDGAESPEEPSGGDLLDEAGQVITAETLADLSAVDLRSTALPNPEGRAVLLFERTGAKPDVDLRDHLASISVQLTVASGDEYGAMMRYVQESATPWGAIRASLDWLAAPAPAGRPRDCRRPSPPRPARRR